MKNSLKSTLIAISALVLSIIIAYGADAIFNLIANQARSTFEPFLVLSGNWLRVAFPIIQAAVMLGLAWVLLIRPCPSQVAPILYIICGFIVIGTYLTILTGVPIEFRKTIIGQFRGAIIALGVNSNLYHMAAFWIIVGIAGLMRRPVKTTSTK